MRTAELLYQALMSEFHNNADAALQHLAERFVAECELTEQLEHCRSRAYTREAPRSDGKIDVPPTNALLDEWIATGKEPAL